MTKRKCARCRRLFDPTAKNATATLGPGCAKKADLSLKREAKNNVVKATKSEANISMSSLRNSPYFPVANKMVQVLPLVFANNLFALKGGTAINLFYKDLPRLSVDIDLMFPVIKSREETLKDLTVGVAQIQSDVLRHFPSAKFETRKGGEGFVTGAYIDIDNIRIELDINPVIRGSVYPVENRKLTTKSQDLFQSDVSVPTLSEADLYGGKIIAALDRQHPRDIFDVKLMLDSPGLTDEIRTAAIVYLLSSARPTNELITPTLKNNKTSFDETFEGMTELSFNYADYVKTRSDLISAFHAGLTKDEKDFILSFTSCEPDWNLLPVNVRAMPALNWKLQNLRAFKEKNKVSFEKQLTDLTEKLVRKMKP
jgi:predicted nucleotidyltransferase component of viral defense system